MGIVMKPLRCAFRQGISMGSTHQSIIMLLWTLKVMPRSLNKGIQRAHI